MKRFAIIILVILCVLLVSFFFLRSNSEHLALRYAEIDTNERIYEISLDVDHGKMFKILQCTTIDGKMAILRLEKNGLGFWQVNDVAKGINRVKYFWDTFAGSAYYVRQDDREPEISYSCEWHAVFCGTNAMKWIEIPDELVPANTTVNVQQIGDCYIVHVVSYSEKSTSAFLEFNVFHVLEECGVIPKSEIIRKGG